jgi:hypothetical protein
MPFPAASGKNMKPAKPQTILKRLLIGFDLTFK